MFRRHQEELIAMLISIFGVAYFMGSFAIKSYGDAAVDSRFLPRILGVALVLLSLLHIIMNLRSGKKDEVKDEAQGFRLNADVLATLGTITCYIALMPFLGFLVATIAYMIAQTLIMLPKDRWNLVAICIISVVFSTAVWAVFVLGFSLTLPAGILG